MSLEAQIHIPNEEHESTAGVPPASPILLGCCGGVFIQQICVAQTEDQQQQKESPEWRGGGYNVDVAVGFSRWDTFNDCVEEEGLSWAT